jgi:hypothetical protein
MGKGYKGYKKRRVVPEIDVVAVQMNSGHLICRSGLGVQTVEQTDGDTMRLPGPGLPILLLRTAWQH